MYNLYKISKSSSTSFAGFILNSFFPPLDDFLFVSNSVSFSAQVLICSVWILLSLPEVGCLWPSFLEDACLRWSYSRKTRSSWLWWAGSCSSTSSLWTKSSKMFSFTEFSSLIDRLGSTVRWCTCLSGVLIRVFTLFEMFHQDPRCLEAHLEHFSPW